ncbi:MAG: FAD-dependent thymidylate synthase [Chlamydiota bacterium]
MLSDYEAFSESQLKVIKKYVTNTSSHIFCLRNLPEVVKGALFSRYSRSSLGLRSLLLKEFILNEATAFPSIVGLTAEESDDDSEDQSIAIKKAQNFYDRMLDGYGDDSIGELGGAHLAIENVSMIGAKAIENARIGGSPLEKSTRYIYFDQKYEGKYLFFREPILMTSAYRDRYVDTCNHLFEVYRELIPPLTRQMEQHFPKEHDVSKVAYTAALRAKVLDCLRGLLPASALTNMGVYGNGRFFETLIRRLNCHNLSELQEIARSSHQELSKVMPSFVRRAELSHKHQNSYAEFHDKTNEELYLMSERYASSIPPLNQPMVRLVSSDSDSPAKVGAALLFNRSNRGLTELQEMCRKLPKEELSRIFEGASAFRQDRRHKSPRALEHAPFTFEIVADYGIYRDLQRHRILTQEGQLLSCNLGYYIPKEILATDMEKAYREAMDRAKITYDEIARELPEEGQYVVPMAYNIHWYFHMNLRSLQWMCELRSSPAGHPMYRRVAQEMARQVVHHFPEFECFFKFVDYDGYELGRLGQEIRTVEKMKH